MVRGTSWNCLYLWTMCTHYTLYCTRQKESSCAIIFTENKILDTQHPLQSQVSCKACITISWRYACYTIFVWHLPFFYGTENGIQIQRFYTVIICISMTGVSVLLSANGLLCTRHAKMSLEMLPSDKCLTAHSTFERSLSSMGACMPLKAFLKWELLSAYITLETFLPSVNYRMLL